MRQLIHTTILENSIVAKDIYLMKIGFPQIAEYAQPGQFINIYFQDRIKLFPRPFSVAGVDQDAIIILYKVVGSQTKQMSLWKNGEPVTVLGPLGNAFQYGVSDPLPVLISGGVGIAPLMFLRDKLSEIGIRPYLFVGARNKDELPLFHDTKSETFLSTDDGSAGFHGTVIDHFLSRKEFHEKPVSLFACGPEEMITIVAKYAVKHRLKCQISLEKVMACGLGLCQGCVVQIHNLNGEPDYALVCKDGPVFNADEIIFND